MNGTTTQDYSALKQIDLSFMSREQLERLVLVQLRTIERLEAVLDAYSICTLPEPDLGSAAYPF